MKWPLGIAVVAVLVAVGGGIAFFFAPPAGADVMERVKACEAEGVGKQECFEELLRREAEERGIGAALDALGVIYEYDTTFATFCHANTHELGVIAYEQFSEKNEVTLSDKTSYCGFGFFHGFLEGLFAHSGDLAEARRFCEYVDTELIETLVGVSFACYHGIGHGVVEGAEPEQWGDTKQFIQEGLDLCEILSPVEEHKERCASGVFNALAIAYLNPIYELRPDRKDPFAICRVQKTRYAREACHDQMNGYIVHTSHSFTEALQVAATAEEEYRSVAIASVGSYHAQSVLAQPDQLSTIIGDCDVLPVPLSDDCARGVASGLLEFGKPGRETDAALEACKAGGGRAGACVRGASQGVRDRLPRERHEPFCAAVEKQFNTSLGRACREVIANRYTGT